ncbi:diacylglycerol kinase family protein [Ferruginibacter albus]|uniref:diacylglycerol kinase family protein n=1 Tax=Ferruginibacter albus TaxID=2875540 RepID=UPI001CC51087|nr:diacylglycerol kinase family protein [Ferruginibacter albus]UAY51675.1 diacylglycerol kinase family protein [Ferruginibacter albus]
MIKLFRSFAYAGNGIRHCIVSQLNFKIHLIATVICIVLGILLHISYVEWIVVVACIAAVLALEMVNTALEEISNVISPGYNKQIKIVKDVAAGAVLISAIGSVVIAVIIFLPKITAFYK